MIPITTLKDKKVLVFGLGITGIAAAKALKLGGAVVAAFDDTESSRAQASELGIPIVDPRESNISQFSFLVLSPGVPLFFPAPHWVVRLFQENRVPIIGDFELFAMELCARSPNTPVIAVTGTNGKSTTVSLLAHVLEASGYRVQLGGNIGWSILDLEDFANDNTVYVLEISSYQIDLAPGFCPTVGVITNVSPDHLERHGTMDNYVASKARLATNAMRAVIGIDDTYGREIATTLKHLGHKITTISTLSKDGDFYSDNRRICNDDTTIDLSASRSLRGQHNLQNACCALAAIKVLGYSLNANIISEYNQSQGTDITTHPRIKHRISDAMLSFRSLSHRMEEVGYVNGVLFVNDSKATNAESTARALACFNSIHLILGGRPKTGGIASLDPYLDRVRSIYLVGESSQEFASYLKGKVHYIHSETIDRAIRDALQNTSTFNETQVILLSPACAAFDQFKNFEVRGDYFRKTVQSLPGFVGI